MVGPRIPQSIDGGAAVTQRSVSLLRLKNGSAARLRCRDEDASPLEPFGFWFAGHAV